MRAIQFILIILLFTLVVMYFRRFQSRLLDRVSVLLLGVIATVLVVMPDWASTLAQLVGVGRGTDLITYLGLVGLAFICLILYSNLRSLESRITDLARAQAIEHAHMPEKIGDGEALANQCQN